MVAFTTNYAHLAERMRPLLQQAKLSPALADEIVDMFRRGVGPTVTPRIMGELQTRVREAMPTCTSGDKTPYSKIMSRFGARMTKLYAEERGQKAEKRLRRFVASAVLKWSTPSELTIYVGADRAQRGVLIRMIGQILDVSKAKLRALKLEAELRKPAFLERFSKLQALWRHRRKHATWALQKIPGLLSQLQALRTENESLKRRLIRYEGPVVDLTGSEDDVEARPADNQLLAAHARATTERLVAVKREVVDQRERADDQGTNAMYLTAQKSELQRLVSDAVGALLEADVPTHECPDGATPFYYMLESHRDDGKQTIPWNPEAGRAMSLAEGIEWARTNRPAKRLRRGA